MAKVGLVFGGRSVEHLVSVQSARTVAQGLAAAGHEVVPLGIAEDGSWVTRARAEAALAGERSALPPNDTAVEPADASTAGGAAAAHSLRRSLAGLLEADIDVVFPIVHGTFGEDGTLQGLCEMLDVPYVGAGVAASAIAMDKLLCKRVLEASGIPVVEYAVVHGPAFERDPAGALAAVQGLAYPLFVKPSVGGSSVGIQRVAAARDLEAAVRHALGFHDVVVIERGVVGRELECAVLGYRTLEASVVGEIVPGRDFYDYEDKYLGDSAKLLAPAPLGDEVGAALREMATRAFAAIGGEGMARVDFFLEGEDRLYINEINTLPGFTRISMYPRLWGLTGLPLEQLTDRLVRLALERHDARRRYDGAVHGWVAEINARAR